MFLLFLWSNKKNLIFFFSPHADYGEVVMQIDYTFIIHFKF